MSAMRIEDGNVLCTAPLPTADDYGKPNIRLDVHFAVGLLRQSNRERGWGQSGEGETIQLQLAEVLMASIEIYISHPFSFSNLPKSLFDNHSTICIEQNAICLYGKYALCFYNIHESFSLLFDMLLLLVFFSSLVFFVSH